MTYWQLYKKTLGIEGMIPEVCPCCLEKLNKYGWEWYSDTEEILCKRPECRMRFKVSSGKKVDDL